MPQTPEKTSNTTEQLLEQFSISALLIIDSPDFENLEKYIVVRSEVCVILKVPIEERREFPFEFIGIVLLDEFFRLLDNKKLASLTQLYLLESQLTTLSTEILQLQNLTTLVLSGNQLASLPKEIVQLQKLTTLNLSRNQLFVLPPEIYQLLKLTTLVLSGNKLANLPEEIAQLKNLTELDLSITNLASLPKEIAQLQKLTTLNLSSNQLASLPPEILQLQNLTNLVLSGNQLASLPKEIVQLKNLTQLDLSGNQLASLSPEILQLQNLTQLRLISNKLASLPKEIAQLQNLTQLVLRGNQLASLPQEIAQLQNLTQLDLSGNQLASLPKEIGQLQNLTQLVLSGNGLASLPQEVAQLQNLTQLDLGKNQLASLPQEVAQLKNLTQLDLSGNQLASLPQEIGQLQNLTQLVLSGNGLASLPQEIGQLQNLTHLVLFHNKLARLPKEIGQLQNLTQLLLYSNRLASLPQEIGQLQNLTELDLSDNQLASLPQEIGQLHNLTELDLRSNQLASLPKEIGQLQNLTQLRLISNQLASLPKEIAQLENLTELDLRGNQLANLPKEIGQLHNLTQLYLSGNQLASLSQEIAQLHNLTKLYLSDNGLASLPKEIAQLQNLTYLDLSENQLASLPKEIIELTKLEKIFLHNNPLAIAIPSELLGSPREGGDAQRIFDFYKKLWEEGGRPLGEARVLVVGEGRVGKTSLVNRLTYDRFNEEEKSTLTVETHFLPIKNHRIQVWDFGGQEHMHATHQFFFSGRSLYLLVFNTGASPEQNKLEYWLNLIRTYSKDSPVILVGNQADAHKMDIEKRRLQEKYPNIRAFVETSALNREGIETLRETIHEQVHAMPQVHVEMPVSYLEIKEEMEEKKRSKPYIAHEQFVEACEKRNIINPKDQDNLLDLLHDLGSVLYFRDEEGEALIPALGVLNPNWVTGGVYRILTHPKANEAKGKLTQALLKEILSAQEYVRHIDDIMKLLERFELCYRSDSSYWIPSIMPRDEPETGNWQGGLTFIYEYPELPKSVIARLIVRTHEWIFEDKVWRTGVVLSKDGNRARIQADEKEKRVYIEVTGNEYARREFLAYIRTNIDEINKNLEPPKTYVRSLRHPSAPLLDFEELRAREKMGKTWEVFDPVSKEILQVNPLEEINGYLLPEKQEDDEREYLGRMREGKGGGTNVTIHIEKMESSNLSVGDANNLTAISNAALQGELEKLSSAVESLLQGLAESKEKEELQENLESLKEEMQRPKPRKRFYQVSVDGLAQAAKNLNEIGKPVLELATTVIKLINNLP